MASSTQIDKARPLRSDAERNRRLILDAAREAFATGGLAVTLDEIARRAGVGVGTVYRRFADKEALIDALFEEGIAELVAQAEEALREEDPWVGFVRWFEGFVGLQAEDRGLKEVVLSSTHGHDRIAASRDRIVPLVSRLLERAQEAGELRRDLRPTDIPMLAQMVAGAADITREVSPELFRRYLAIVLDGLRVRRDDPSRLPARALSLDEFEATRRPPRR
jgi:AcrR family transcriptional regulator